MPPSVPLKSKPDEKDIELLDYSGAINQLVINSKKELEEVRNQINTANFNLSQLRDKTIKDTNELERWKREEKLKYTNELTKRQNEVIANQNRINLEVQQQERITSDLRTQQSKFDTLNQERIALKEEMMKLESRKIELADMMKQIEARNSESISLQNQGSMALAKAAEQEQRNTQENIRLVNMNDQLEKRSKDIEEQIKSHTNLKDFVEPKLRSIREEQEALDIAKNENEERISKLQSIMQEEKIMLQSITDKRIQLDKDINSFTSQKQEFERSQALSGK